MTVFAACFQRRACGVNKVNLTYVALLQLQRELYSIPRGMNRFKQYLRTMVREDGVDLELPPLVIMNPMAKDHVPALLDAFLALDADGIAARSLAAAASQLQSEPGEYKAALVLADDLHGGWTNRFASEFMLRFQNGPSSRRFWVMGILWSSEPAAAETVRAAILLAAFRAAYVQRHGPAQTLRDMLAQEGQVMSQAGCRVPALDEEEIDYTREVLTPYLDAKDMRTAIECLFGDAAGRTLGFTPRGLSPWAGLALALHDACHPEIIKHTLSHSPGET